MRKLAPTLAAAAFLCTVGTAQAGWFSDEVPPANAKPLSEIIKVVEDQGFRTISEVEFDDGVWKIEAHQRDGKEVHLRVDAVAGAIRPH